MKNMCKVLLLASVMSAFTSQVIFASEVASSEIASEIALTDNERERERVTPAKWILVNLKHKILMRKIQNQKN